MHSQSNQLLELVSQLVRVLIFFSLAVLPATWVAVGYTLQNSDNNEKPKAEALFVWFKQKSSRTGPEVAAAPNQQPTAADPRRATATIRSTVKAAMQN